MMRKKINEIILTGKTPKDLPRVVEALRGFEESELFEGLFRVSVDEQALGKGVAFSAYALNELNPKCKLTLEDAVNALLPKWDVSLEEVVFYLAKQFGKESLIEYLSSIKPQLGQRELARVEMIEYWLGVYKLKR